jgi:hypothetical protein
MVFSTLASPRILFEKLPMQRKLTSPFSLSALGANFTRQFHGASVKCDRIIAFIIFRQSESSLLFKAHSSATPS